ncbi:MAG: hypothetical protein JNK15_18750 [Planctomycetes bacterium]|nr:hypothetical protein [Planctomycetota bacterium]
MDPIDAFYQHLDSEQLLRTHGASLLADAREALAENPAAKVAGLITTADSPDAVGVRAMLAKATGQQPPPGLMVGLIPRAIVESMLSKQFGSEPWLEQGWQPQQVLPVVVSTRDGHRIGLLGLGDSADRPTQM